MIPLDFGPTKAEGFTFDEWWQYTVDKLGEFYEGFSPGTKATIAKPQYLAKFEADSLKGEYRQLYEEGMTPESAMMVMY
jgi:hypothetical protein